MAIAEKKMVSEQNAAAEVLDLLDRQPFIERLITIANTLSDNKKNACYAINGGWGTGKSFVLDLLEKQLSEVRQKITMRSQYLVFRYNCWEYDYYDEPLIAIVASIMDQIDNVNILEEKSTKCLIAILKNVAKRLSNKVLQAIEGKTDIPISEIIKLTKEGGSAVDAELKEKYSFDEYATFKDTLMDLRESIQELAKDQTVVFIVDELDRCLPEYTIKVLERLHHLFDDIPNVQVILSIDKEQIKHTVKGIYGGNDSSVNRYLAKFIDFEILLAEGSLNDKFNLKFNTYTQLFAVKNEYTHEEDVADFVKMVFEGLDARSCNAIVEKCQLLHSLAHEGTEIMDTAFMCIEIFLAVLKHNNLDTERAKRGFSFPNIFGRESSGSLAVEITRGLKKLCDYYKEAYAPSGRLYFVRDRAYVYISADNIWGLLLGCYRFILGERDDEWLRPRYEKKSITSYAKEFWELLNIVC